MCYRTAMDIPTHYIQSLEGDQWSFLPGGPRMVIISGSQGLSVFCREVLLRPLLLSCEARAGDVDGVMTICINNRSGTLHSISFLAATLLPILKLVESTYKGVGDVKNPCKEIGPPSSSFSRPPTRPRTKAIPVQSTAQDKEVIHE